MSDDEHYTTVQVAQMLDLAVRSVQLMVDRGDLDAWKTPGGHRRISRASVQRWIDAQPFRQVPPPLKTPSHLPSAPSPGPGKHAAVRVLLIEDSVHFQNLIGLLMRQRFPEAQLRIAADGIVGLAMVGEWQPDVLIVDIMLPGIDGATLITSLRTHPQFSRSKLVVVTSLDEKQRAPYAFALEGVPVVHKPRLVAELPGWLDALISNK